MKYIVIIVLVTSFLGFLYWGYLPDYKRNSKEFWRTLIGMPIGMFLGGLGLQDLNEKIRKWAVDDTKKKNKQP